MPTTLISTGEYSRSANVPTQSAATIMAIVNLNANSGYAGVLSLFRNASGREIGIISTEGSSTLNLYWTNSGASSSVALTTNAAANVWFCVALTSAGTGIGALDGYFRRYIDTAWTTASNSSAVDALAPDRIFVNEDGYGSNGPGMDVCYVRAWDRVLSSDELTAEMYSAFAFSRLSLNGDWPLFDTTTDQDDYSGNGRALTVGGTPANYTTDGPPVGFMAPWMAPAESAIFAAAAAGNDIAAVGALSITGAADLDALGQLAAAGSLSISGAADLDAIGTLVAAGSLAITGAAELSGSLNDIVAAGSLSITGVASLTALGELSASGSIVIVGAATLTGEAAAVEQPSGGWEFFAHYEREQQVRRRKRRELEEREEESARIADETTREIALLLRKQEAQDERRAELERLSALIDKHADRASREAYGARVAQALARAYAQGNVSALMALERELERAKEEEDFMLLALLAIDAED